MNREEGVIWVTFDYMNEGEGCVVEIFDDIDRFHDISVTGSIKGIKEIQRKVLAKSDLRTYLVFACCFLSLPIILWVFSFFFQPLLAAWGPALFCTWVLMAILDQFLGRKFPISHTEFYLEKVLTEEFTKEPTTH